MSPAVTHLLYLHGFRSSPLSMKARMTAAWVQQHRPAVHWWCPQLPPSPREAMQLVFERMAGWPAQHSAVIGSSLGGFYAVAVAERLGCPAVLLNPAVHPARDLARHIGPNDNQTGQELQAWHSDERFFFRAEFIDELRAMEVPALTRAQRYFAVIAQGDEVLSWQEMSERFAGCRVKLLAGGDHALSDYAEHLPDVTSFLGL